MSTPHIILVIGDETRQRDDLHDLMRAQGYQPMTASTCEEALELARVHKPSVALIDLWMADLPGHVVLHGVRQASPGTECIALLTSPAQQEGAHEALRMGAFTFVRHGYDSEQIITTVRRAVEKVEAARALRDLQARLAVLFDSLPVGVLIVDDRTNAVVDANPAAVAAIGAPKAEIVGAVLQSRLLAAAAPAGGGTQTGRRIPATRTVAALTIGGRKHRLESFVDMTGRLDVEQRLAAGNAVNRLLLGPVRDLVMTVDAAGAVSAVQAAGRGVASASAGDESSSLLPAPCRERYRQTLAQVLRDGHPANFSAGTPPLESWSVRIEPIAGPTGVTGAAVRVRDLAARGREVERLQFRDRALDVVRHAMLTINTEGKIVDANSAARQLLDADGSELTGMRFAAIDTPSPPRAWATLWAATADGPVRYDARHRTLTGRTLQVSVTLTRIDAEGAALVVALVELHGMAVQPGSVGEAARQQSLLDAITDPAWLVDRDGRVVAANAATGDGASGRYVADLLPAPIAAGRLEAVETVFRRGAPARMDDTLDGRHYSTVISPIRDAQQVVVLALLVTREVTDAHDRDAQLEALWGRAAVGLVRLSLTDAAQPGDARGTAGAPDHAAVLAGLTVRAANAEALRMLGAANPHAAQRVLANDLFPESSVALVDALGAMSAGAATTDFELLVHAEEDARALEAHVMPEHAGEGASGGALLSLVDRTLQQRAERAIMLTAVQEQRRLGALLSSVLSRPLDALHETAARLRAACGDAGGPPEALASQMSDALERLREQTGTVVRSLAGDGLAEAGLMASLMRLGDDTGRRGVACRCSLSAAALVRDRRLARHLSAIAKEAVDYALRREGAGHITISVKASPEEGTLTIRDDAGAADADREQDPAWQLIRMHAAYIRADIEYGRDANGRNTLACRFKNG